MDKMTLSDELWRRIRPHIPSYLPSALGGRPRLNPKQVFEGIAYLKAHKLPWKAIDREIYGSKTALNDYYRAWARKGVFHALEAENILGYPELAGIDFDWAKIEQLFGQANRHEG